MRRQVLIASVIRHIGADDALIDAAIKATGAESIRDMGKVMGQVKAEAAGRADMGAIGAKVKARLG